MVRCQVVARELWAVLSFMTYFFGAIKTDLEKAFRLSGAPPLEQPQKQNTAELSESELSTVLFEHPDV